MGNSVIYILWMRELRLKEAKAFACSPLAVKLQRA